MAEDLDHSTKLAFNRTWLAEERTLMAWIRTATSLITFGFAIYSFFGIPSGAGHGITKHVLGPRIFAVGLIVMGLISLLLAVFQRRKAMRDMKSVYPTLERFSGGEVIAVLIGCLGLFGLIVVLVRL
jgi:putative membrane protein